MADRYRAELDTIPLECEDLRDEFRKSIARYDYPYADGVDTDDLGIAERAIQIRCWFIGEAYPAHADLVEHLKTRELFELIHPKYGLVKGRVERVSVSHDDLEETARVDLDFVEDASSTIRIEQLARDVQGEAEEAFESGQTELMEKFSADVTEALGAEAAGILSQELDPDLTLLEQLTGLTFKARAYIKKVDGWVTSLTADLSALANPANSLLYVINYPNTVAGRVIGTLARTVERYALVRSGLLTAPNNYLDSLRSGLALLTSAAAALSPTAVTVGGLIPAGFEQTARIAGAQRLGLAAAEIYKLDAAGRDEAGQGAGRQGFDVEGNYLGQAPAATVMTVADLEKSLVLVRTELQAAVEISRSVTTLKDLALALQRQVVAVKSDRDALMAVELDNPIPLHLVCLKYGLSYREAERLLKVNQIPHPSFTQGEVRVYAR